MRAGRGVEVKTPEQIVAMRAAGLVVERALTAVGEAIAPGVTTADLNRVAAEVIAAAGATPSFLDYGAAPDGTGGFPGVICTSVNDEIVHGIPSDRRLVAGDLISVDCGAVVAGWHGDAARTFAVGEVSAEARRLSETTRAALWAGIGAARLGGRVGDVSAAVEAASGDYGIIEEFVGHGIGSAMHQPPDVHNYRVRGRTPRIVAGMALAVEPMLTLGAPDNATLDDGWTVVTRDGGIAAHWEHTMTVTPRGVWVLTAADGGEAELAAAGVPFGPLAD